MKKLNKLSFSGLQESFEQVENENLRIILGGGSETTSGSGSSTTNSGSGSGVDASELYQFGKSLELEELEKYADYAGYLNAGKAISVAEGAERMADAGALLYYLLKGSMTASEALEDAVKIGAGLVMPGGDIILELEEHGIYEAMKLINDGCSQIERRLSTPSGYASAMTSGVIIP